MRNGRHPSLCLWAGLTALLLLLATWPAGAAASPDAVQIEIVLSDSSPLYRQLAGKFQTELSLACANRCPVTPSVRVSDLDDWQPETPRDLLVPVGNEAALMAARHQPTRVLYGLIPRSTWQAIRRLDSRPAGAATAVFLEQPLDRQFRLLNLAMPADRRRVGVLLGPESGRQEQPLRAAAIRAGIALSVRHVLDWDEVGPTVETLANDIDVLLALPDPVVFNRDTLYGILLTSYGAGVPVVGYSRALVRAGAMLGLFTSVPDMARHLAQSTADFIVAPGQPLPAAGSSRYFEVAVNASVARSLGFTPPDPVELRRKLQTNGGRDETAQAAQ